MIVPDSVRKEWLAKRDEIEILSEDLQTTRTQLNEDLQTTRTDLQTTRTQLNEDLETTRTQLNEDLQTTRTQLNEDLQTTRNQLQEDLQTELEVTKLKLLNTEARLNMVEQTMTSILSKLNV
jgi:F0F1-type ATP synthase membrane subunit b/b'